MNSRASSLRPQPLSIKNSKPLGNTNPISHGDVLLLTSNKDCNIDIESIDILQTVAAYKRLEKDLQLFCSHEAIAAHFRSYVKKCKLVWRIRNNRLALEKCVYRGSVLRISIASQAFYTLTSSLDFTTTRLRYCYVENTAAPVWLACAKIPDWFLDANFQKVEGVTTPFFEKYLSFFIVVFHILFHNSSTSVVG